MNEVFGIPSLNTIETISNFVIVRHEVNSYLVMEQTKLLSFLVQNTTKPKRKKNTT